MRHALHVLDALTRVYTAVWRYNQQVEIENSQE